MRRRFRLLKETPELKAGAILEEMCDDGDQNFEVISDEWDKMPDQDGTSYTRQTVMEQPEWFEEMYPLYLSESQTQKIRQLLGI